MIHRQPIFSTDIYVVTIVITLMSQIKHLNFTFNNLLIHFNRSRTHLAIHYLSFIDTSVPILQKPAHDMLKNIMSVNFMDILDMLITYFKNHSFVLHPKKWI